MSVLKKILVYLSVSVFSLFLFSVIFHFGLFYLYDGKVYPGVSVAGKSFSGRPFSEFEVELNNILKEFEESKIAFSIDEYSLRMDLKWLQFSFDKDNTVVETKLFGRSGNILKDIGNEITALFSGYNIKPKVEYNDQILEQTYVVISNKVNQDAKDASLVIHNEKILVEGAEAKREVTLEQFQRAFDNQTGILRRNIVVPVVESDVEITNSIAHDKVKQAEQIISSDIILTWEGKNWVIDKDEYENFLQFLLHKKDGIVSLDIEIRDEQYLETKLQNIASEIDESMQEAIIKEIDGKKFALQLPKNGKVLNIGESIAKIRSSFTDVSTGNIELIVTELTSGYLEEQGIIDVTTLVSQGQSKFPIGSGQESRVHNIQTAAGKIHDYVVAPGEVFSTNAALGEISTKTGYWGGLALIGGRYAPAVGGGVCEISTDIFRAALYGGYEIVSRRNHSAVLFHYDWPQRGIDATIFPDTGLDFTFKNDTAYYLLIQTSVDPDTGLLSVDFYSTQKLRDVTLSDSEIYNIIQPGKPLNITDSSLKKGQKIMTEVPAPGQDIKVTRTINANGVVTAEDFYSHYVPWRAVYLVGE